MDARIKRILCESAKEKWTFICEDGGAEYYTSGKGLFSASEEQLRTGKGEAFALITSKYCGKDIHSVFKADDAFNDMEWTVVGVCSNVKAPTRGEHREKTIVRLPSTVEYIAMEGKYGCYNFLFDVDKDNSHYKSDIYSSYPACGAVFSKDGTELLCCESKTPDYGYLRGVNKIGDISITGECVEFNIPSSIKSINSAHLKCNSIRFEGDLPKLGDISDVYAKKIYVNCPLKDIPKDAFEKLSNVLTDVKYRGEFSFNARLITKKPKLSTKTPNASGLIGLTRVDNDEYEYINPRYIVKMEPVSFEKYDGIETGTRVLYAAHGTQQAISVDYYEKLIDVDNKIKDAQETLAKSIGGLAGLLDVVKDMYETSQKDIII